MLGLLGVSAQAAAIDGESPLRVLVLRLFQVGDQLLAMHFESKTQTSSFSTIGPCSCFEVCLATVMTRSSRELGEVSSAHRIVLGCTETMVSKHSVDPLVCTEEYGT